MSAPSGPIPNARFTIKTPPIIEAFEDFSTLIEFRDPGGYFVAPQRWGKTRAARYLCKALVKTFGPIPHLFVPLRESIKKGAIAFFSYLLNQAKYRYVHSAHRTETDLRNLFTECVATRARRSRHKMFLLVVDEAQLLTLEQWGFLFNISNEIDALGLNLVVLLVGQPKLVDAREKLLDDGREEIVERFLQRRLRFRGLVTCSELEFVLKALDEMEMPPGSGRRYLSHWCPLAVEGGWRLSSEAAAFWSEFKQLYNESNVRVVELPMTYVINSVNRFLVAVSKVDSVDLKRPDGIHKSSVSSSGVAASIVSTRRRQEKKKPTNTSGARVDEAA